MNPFRQCIIAEIATISGPPKRRRRRMFFGFVPPQEKQGAVQTLLCVHAFITILFASSVCGYTHYLYCAGHKCCQLYEQFVQDFVESHPICEVCEKILPKMHGSMVRILT